MSKVIVVSDIHLHKWNYGSTVTKEGLNSRLVKQLNYLYLIRDIAVENKVKEVFCLGDLFHTNSTIQAEVLAAAWKGVNALYNSGVRFNCIVGNHDMASKDGSIHSLDWLRHYGTVVDKPMSFELGGRKAIAVPYTESIELLQHTFNRPNHRYAEIALLHQGVNLNDSRGSAWVLNEIFTKEMVPENIKRVFTGHYHKPCDDGKISIVGSPMQHTWSDYDNAVRGIVLLDTDTLEFTRIPNKYSPKFIKLDWVEDEFTYLPREFFAKISNCPQDKMEHTREDLLNDGALSVEFDIPNEPVVSNDVVKSEFISFDSILSEYESVVEDRRRAVGRQLRERLYETVKVPS